MFDVIRYYGLIKTIVILAFIFIIILIIIRSLHTGFQWHKNNHTPQVSTPSTVVSKRIDVTHHNHGANMNQGMGFHTSTSTKYYVTFQVEHGDRIEFKVSGHQYGLLAKRDQGIVTYQGTRFICFRR